MNKAILSTKNNNALKIPLLFSIIFSIVFICVAWHFVLLILENAEHSNNLVAYTCAIIFSAIAITITVWQGLCILKSAYYLSSYIEIYDGYVEGVGVQGYKLVPFKFEKKNITCVSISKSDIFLATSIGIFIISTNNEIATKIYEYFN